jgi:hypothetical protein
MKKEPVDLPPAGPEEEIFTWNATMLRIGRNRMMVLQNSGMRCVLILYRPMAKDFAVFEDRLKDGIRLLFEKLGIPESQTEKYLEQAGSCVLTRSGTRKEIGRLVQMCKDLKYSTVLDEALDPDGLQKPIASLWCSEYVLWRVGQGVMAADEYTRTLVCAL